MWIITARVLFKPDSDELRPGELARPYFTRQAQSGRRVIFAWRPADASPTNPLTQPWPGADELIEGVEFASEEAARRFDLDRAAGPSGRSTGADVPDAGPFVEFLTWEGAKRWLRGDEP
ncbi:MAG: hypothetical protein M3Q65_25075 [Chloroflexota bacterium]|nr:hypothetical protein [Chloroflexota bacterium]